MGKRGKAGIFIAITGLLLISAGLLQHRQAYRKEISKEQVQEKTVLSETGGQEAVHTEEDRGNVPLSVTFFAMDTVITIEAYDGEERGWNGGTRADWQAGKEVVGNRGGE